MSFDMKIDAHAGEGHCEAGLHHARRGGGSCQCGALRMYDAVALERVEVPRPTPMTPEQADATIAAFEAKGMDGVRGLSTPGCRFCGVAYTRNFVEYTMQIWDDERGVSCARFHVCTAKQCRALAEKDVGDARMNVERDLELARQQAVVDRLAPATEEYHGAIGARVHQRQCRHQTFGQRVEIDEVSFHAAAERLRADQLAVSTSSALVGVMRNESSPLDARFADCVSSGAADARRCAACLADLVPLTSWLHSLLLPNCATTFVTCTKEECMAWAQRIRHDAAAAGPVAKAPPCRGNVHHFAAPSGPRSGQVCSCGERYGETIEGRFRMQVTAAGSDPSGPEVAYTPGARHEAMVIFGVPVGKAPTPEQLPAIRARLDEIRRESSRPIMLDADPPPPRPDGFAQSQVDAAKAALLAHVPRRGAK